MARPSASGKRDAHDDVDTAVGLAVAAPCHHARMSDVPVTVRDAVPDDAARLVELLELGALRPGKQNPADLGPYRAAIVEIAASAPSAVLVAEVHGDVVGMLQLIVFRHVQERGARCAEIESMHVHPVWRGRGVGGVLLEAAVARATQARCWRVQLTSDVARLDAHRFYERHGFEPTHVGFKQVLADRI